MRRRLRERPERRGSSSDAFIAEHKQFAYWLLEHAASAYDPPLRIVDTSHAPVTDVALAVASWVRSVLAGHMTREPAYGSSNA